MKKEGVSILLGGGGNKVFYTLGFLQELHDQGVTANELVGLSASAGIMFEEISGARGLALKTFGQLLKENKKNFYFFKRPHFPHNDIYKNSMRCLLEKVSKNCMEWKLIAVQSPQSFPHMRALIATMLLLFRGTRLKDWVMRFLDMEEVVFNSNQTWTQTDLLNIVMGSSTIYPFIQPHFHKGSLILEGGLAARKYENLFDYKKALHIIPKRGITESCDGVLRLYSREAVPQNVLDYTNEQAIIDMYNSGRKEAGIQIGRIKSYLCS